MAPILARFRKAHPTARLTLSEGTTDSLERDLEQGSIDVAFLHPPLHAPGLSARRLCRASLVCSDCHPDGPTRPAIVVEGFPDFGFEEIGRRATGELSLETAIAWRALDRRPAVRALIDAKVPD